MSKQTSRLANMRIEDYRYFEVAVRRGWIRPVTQDRAREMCEKILVAALEVFAKQGYKDTKVHDVTRVAGCSVGIFYKRFIDKEGLFYTLQYRHYELANRMLDRLASAHVAKLSTSRVFSGFVQRTLENMVSSSGFHKALVEMALIDVKANRARRVHIQYAGEQLYKFLVRRQELPESEELEKKVQFAVSVVFSTITNLVVLGPGPYPVKDPRVVENLAEFLEGFVHEAQRRLNSD